MHYLTEKLKKIQKMIRIYVPGPVGWFRRGFLFLDFAAAVVWYGVNIDEYFQYRFFEKRRSARRTYIVHRKRMRIIRACNNEADRVVFDQKTSFNKVFAGLINRSWLYVPESSFSQFEAFIKEEAVLFVKPSAGFYGRGVRYLDAAQAADPAALYRCLRAEGALVEQPIRQHEAMAAFHPASVNTLRLVTLLTKSGEVKIVTANLRCGNLGCCADNFHHGGLAALIDLSTGIVCTPGVDRYLNRYCVHPQTGKQIVGFQVPFWSEITAAVKKAARVVPTVRYVGWDVAVGRQGEVIVVEGNAGADPDVSQIPDGIGKWPLYQKYESFALRGRRW